MMVCYLLKRVTLIPVTLFFIILINFIIINLSPGEPADAIQISSTGEAVGNQRSVSFTQVDRYLQFRQFYGLTLPILLNTWPWISFEQVLQNIKTLTELRRDPAFLEKNLNKYDNLMRLVGDQASFTMPHLLQLMKDPQIPLESRVLASFFFVRGGTKLPQPGFGLSKKEREKNRFLADNNRFLLSHMISEQDSIEEKVKKIENLSQWYRNNEKIYGFAPNVKEKIKILFTETRFYRYFSKVLTLDFGSLRNDPNKLVIYEVSKRFKYSFTLAVIPMLLSFTLSLLFGFLMAYFQNRFLDRFLSTLFLLLYAIPVFVVAPFLIEYFALREGIWFLPIKFPLGGFSSPPIVYEQLTSIERLRDIAYHLVLPVTSALYGSLAASARLARNTCLEFKRAPFITAALSRGLSTYRIYSRHIGKNVAIVIVTSIAGSLGVILGGSLIIETLFEIDGFGRFFYQAILNRDYNVMMFSALAGSFLSLLGYLLADIAYMLLDPRVSLE